MEGIGPTKSQQPCQPARCYVQQGNLNDEEKFLCADSSLYREEFFYWKKYYRVYTGEVTTAFCRAGTKKNVNQKIAMAIQYLIFTLYYDISDTNEDFPCVDLYLYTTELY